MAHVEPMDLDSIESDFDNKENTFQHNNAQPRVLCTEKGCEELDVSDLNMKLRYPVTPAASPMSKSYTANCVDNRNITSNEDISFTNNHNLTRSLNSTMTNSESILKSPKSLPLQSISTDEYTEFKRNSIVRRSFDIAQNNVTITVTGSQDLDDNLSLPSTSSSLTHTPEATTPTKEIPKQDGGSPIMRGLKSVLSMFRSSQSPIPPNEENLIEKKCEDVPVSEIEEATNQTVLASTPIRCINGGSKSSSPLKESIVFKEDLERELQWKDDSTIIFKEEKIPIHKLFFPNPINEIKPSNISSNILKEVCNDSVEHMDVSLNVSAMNEQCKPADGNIETSITSESDSEFQDCETTFTKTEERIPTSDLEIVSNNCTELTQQDINMSIVENEYEPQEHKSDRIAVSPAVLPLTDHSTIEEVDSEKSTKPVPKPEETVCIVNDNNSKLLEVSQVNMNMSIVETNYDDIKLDEQSTLPSSKIETPTYNEDVNQVEIENPSRSEDTNDVNDTSSISTKLFLPDLVGNTLRNESVIVSCGVSMSHELNKMDMPVECGIEQETKDKAYLHDNIINDVTSDLEVQCSEFEIYKTQNVNKSSADNNAIADKNVNSSSEVNSIEINYQECLVQNETSILKDIAATTNHIADIKDIPIKIIDDKHDNLTDTDETAYQLKVDLLPSMPITISECSQHDPFLQEIANHQMEVSQDHTPTQIDSLSSLDAKTTVSVENITPISAAECSVISGNNLNAFEVKLEEQQDPMIINSSHVDSIQNNYVNKDETKRNEYLPLSKPSDVPLPLEDEFSSNVNCEITDNENCKTETKIASFEPLQHESISIEQNENQCIKEELSKNSFVHGNETGFQLCNSEDHVPVIEKKEDNSDSRHVIHDSIIVPNVTVAPNETFEHNDPNPAITTSEITSETDIKIFEPSNDKEEVLKLDVTDMKQSTATVETEIEYANNTELYADGENEISNEINVSRKSIGIDNKRVLTTPPSSPKIVSKGYNFNFDEIDDPFATKTKIRESPPPASSSDNVFIPIQNNEKRNSSNSNKKISHNRRKSQPVTRNKTTFKKDLNSTVDITNCLTKLEDTDINVQPCQDNKAEDALKKEIEQECKDTLLKNPNTELCEKKTESLECLNKTDECPTENENNAENDHHNTIKPDAMEIPVECHTKNVFNIPEIDDKNFNPFASRSKICMSPPALNSSKAYDDINQAHVCDDTMTVTTATNELDANTESESSSNINNVTFESKHTDEYNDTVREVHTEDEDTIEGPFLEAEDLAEFDKDSDILPTCEKDDMIGFDDFPIQSNEDNGDNAELFIDAEAFEFLLNQNKSNVVADSGKESLFLKFDPLFAKRVSSDGIFAALNKPPKRVSTPKKEKQVLNKDLISESFACTSSSRPSGDFAEDININMPKPTMIVNPAVNPIVSPRKAATPPKINRQSLTLTSPAMAVIDRLLSLSGNGNSSVLNLDTSMPQVNVEQHLTDLALTQLREMLAEKEIHVQTLRAESKSLKDRLAVMEGQVKSLESESQDRLRKITYLNEKLAEKMKLNKTMASVVEEYERTIASLVAELEQDKKRHAEERSQLIRDRDEQTAHLASMEVSFSDLHSKYEKSKQIIFSLKANEETYKKSIKEFEENLVKMQNNYELLKQHATSKLNHANSELEKMNRAHEAEVLKLNAMIKRKDLHITSLEETLTQKTKANEELTAICDELLNKVG